VEAQRFEGAYALLLVVNYFQVSVM